MKWQRGARLGLAALGVGTAVAIYLLTGERPDATRPPPTRPADPAATSESGPCVQIKYVLDNERWKLECGATRTYPDRIEWDNAHVIFREDGTEVWADRAEAAGATQDEAPASLRLKGNVRLRTGEGATVSGDEAHYDDSSGLTRIPGPVTFSRGRFSGTGTGAVYERHAGVFRLLADARVVSAPGPAPAAGVPAGTVAESAIEATSASLVFNRAANALLLEGNAVINHKPDKMTGDQATLYLSDDGERFRVIELRGKARVIPDPAGGSKTPDMQAQDIDLAFHDGTQTLQRAVLSQQGRIVTVDEAGRRSIEGNVINLTTAPDGNTLTHLEASERVRVLIPASATSAAREITSSVLIATGNDGVGLTAATFTGGVVFVERTAAARGRAAGQRRGTGETLILQLKGKLEAIDEAHFQQNVKFVDGDVSGEADLGTYLVSQGKLRLEPHPRNPRLTPLVNDTDMRVEAARLVEIDLNTHDVHAQVAVKTFSTGKSRAKPAASTARGRGAAARTEPALFGGEGTVLGFSEEFRYDRAKQEVRYTGTQKVTARVKQGDSEVTGIEVVLNDATRDLTATGKVTSTMPIDAANTKPGAKVTHYTAEADRMVYRDAERTVLYVGVPVTLKTPDGQTQAAEVLLTLSEEGNKLERMDAKSGSGDPLTADVRSSLAEGQEALSEILLYEAGPNRYTFRGRPFVLRTRNSDGTCTESRGNFGYFTPADKVLVIPQGSQNPAQSHSRPVACGDPLKK